MEARTIRIIKQAPREIRGFLSKKRADLFILWRDFCFISLTSGTRKRRGLLFLRLSIGFEDQRLYKEYRQPD